MEPSVRIQFLPGLLAASVVVLLAIHHVDLAPGRRFLAAPVTVGYCAGVQRTRPARCRPHLRAAAAAEFRCLTNHEELPMPEDLPDFDRFDQDDAWRVGSALVDRCRRDHLPVVISITIGEQRAFHVALPGSSADNDDWVDRKARVVRRFGRSSLEVAERYVKGDPDRFFSAFGLTRADYAPGEGAVPIRVRGAIVGVLAISGLETGGDHALAVAGLRGEA
jgi:uncharacterized protein (UPF0303 family)